MSLSEHYATRIRHAADTFDRLDVDRRDPARYHELKNETVSALRKLADAVEIDQVFAGRQGLEAERSTFRHGPRHVHDRHGRVVAVETRRRSARTVPGRN